MGVMLALSAVFAVVISTISMPGDRASGQAADENVMKSSERAEAWWSVLSAEQRTNAILGKDYDHDTDTSDDDPVGESDGRQLPPEASGGYPALTATGTAGSGTPPTGGTIGKDNVDALVDGAVASPGDIYSVGDHLADVDQALRGFQSVELWWMYLDCTEARIAVGEDDDAIDQTDQDTEADGLQPETSAVCTVNLNEAGDAVDSANPVTKTAYADLDDDTKALVNTVGQAINGLDAPGSPSSADNARAKAWWDKLNAAQMVDALYGDGATDGDPTRTPPEDGSNPFTRPELAQKMYDMLDDATKTLVNDRWQWIYNMGGMNDMGTAQVVYWWNSIGCAAMNVATGSDNDVNTGLTPNFCAMWDALNPDTDAATPGHQGGTQAGQESQARVLELGQAILGIDPPAPDVEKWWNSLNEDQMVYVVYGNPPRRTAYDDPNDDPDAGATVTKVTDDDKAVFTKMYADLEGGIEVDAVGTALSTHLPAYVVEMLARNAPTDDFTTVPTGVDTDADTTDDMWYYSAKGIVDAIANEIFDPPTMAMAWARPDNTLVDTSEETGGTVVTITDDEDFDWPYTPNNEAATVGDWWERTDCRVMRIAVGQDNQYLNAAIPAVVGVDNSSPADGDFDDPGDVAPVDAIPAETSIYCGHFPGTTYVEAGVTKTRVDGSPGVLSKAAQMRVEVVGRALLGLGNDPGRFTSNEPPTGTPTISGVAQVGAELTADASGIADEDGLGTLMYQWLRDGDDIPGATSSKYTLQPADVGAAISVRVSFTDNERQYEMVTSSTTSIIAGSPGEISRIEPAIRSVTASAGDEVVLSVNIYGLQGVMDNSIGGAFTWSVNGTADSDLGTGREIDFTVPSSPGTYTVTATLGGGSCQPDEEANRDDDCSASITVRVKRPSAPVEPDPEPVNPPGDIPEIIPDSDGNQYAVFTPVEGGTFDAGEGYSISVPSGAVPNGEYIGIRMSDGGAASNLGMTHQRYTLGGNMYGIHAVDASQAAISSYALEDPAQVCVPLPDELRSRISDLALVGINSDGSLTIHAASVRIDGSATQVCGNVSNLPTTVAVGSQGAPDAIPTATPEPVPVLPDTGATAPSSNSALWALILGIAIVSLGTLVALGRRRNRSVSR